MNKNDMIALNCCCTHCAYLRRKYAEDQAMQLIDKDEAQAEGMWSSSGTWYPVSTTKHTTTKGS